jgi:antirestriction protein
MKFLLTVCIWRGNMTEAVYNKCPKCGSENTRVCDNRAKGVAGFPTRIRKCVDCGARWKTCEVPESRLNELEEAWAAMYAVLEDVEGIKNIFKKI